MLVCRRYPETYRTNHEAIKDAIEDKEYHIQMILNGYIFGDININRIY